MSNAEDNLYSRAGVGDVRDFYRTKFVSDEVLDARYFKALDRFDIRFARTMWVYDNVRAGSTVLDLGCGAGMLALLKRKGVTLTGVDLSAECASAARRNGYDFTAANALAQLPFRDHSFDYVVSLDVIGHIGFEEKDAVLAEIKRVLRPDGVTLHGIECTDHATRKNYDEMTADELRAFVDVDGHVGLEEEQEHGQRFLKFFQHVAWEPRYTLNLSSEEFIKQADRYGLDFDEDFLEYLRGLSFKERRAFDMAMGYVFGKISDLNLSLPKSGLYVFLKASNVPLGHFYNEHRDRSALSSGDGPLTAAACLDRDPQTVFDDGWYEPNLLPPVARWMGRQARVRFNADRVAGIGLDLATHMPDVGERPLAIDFILNGEMLTTLKIGRNTWVHVNLVVPERVTIESAGKYELEIRADRTWQPRPLDNANRDDREISIAVCNIEIKKCEREPRKILTTEDTEE
ncbi:MAG TPA: methyltransferase domain-containing protein, partial [Pyrinomonadaceae bacterium]|nr:methyltransferase domain-containing protein [Pyrinomonadaceae bacterium]